MFTLFYLKSEFVTGYLSILKDFIFTSLVGDSPSFPSAALVPINIFPLGMLTISFATGQQEGTCLTQWHGETFCSHQVFMSLKSRDFLPVAATKQAVHSRMASSTFIFDKFNYNELNLRDKYTFVSFLRKHISYLLTAKRAKLTTVSMIHIFSLQRKCPMKKRFRAITLVPLLPDRSTVLSSSYIMSKIQ